MGQEHEMVKAFSFPSPSNVMYGVQVKGMNQGTQTRLHFLSVGYDKEDKLYMLIFETPEEFWEKNSKIASPLLNMFGLGE
ncbi:MAG: hypothetical protein ACJAWS_002974 [Oleiphilaceae bacterium]|jgi:hypothetical protein